MKGFPDIPNFKGLPSAGLDAAISFGGSFVINKLFGEQWGVYNQYGIPVLLADSVTSVRYENTSEVAHAPIQKGSFASYNKVGNPYKATVQMTKGGGNPSARGLFIAQLETLAKSTLLFHVVTPEYVHRNATITGFDYAREAQSGARIIVANLRLEEVREVKVKYDREEPANPEDTETVDSGDVETKEADESMLSKIVGKAETIAGEVTQTVREKVNQAMDQFKGATP